VTIAALPGWGGTQRLPRLIGPGWAKQMILTGQPIEAARAEAFGLVAEVVPAEALIGRARELARQIAANAPLAVRAAKRLALPASPAATLEVPASMAVGATEDAREGRESFLERRPPAYRGR
jgi:enoyl-CoA hydratase/carnithine racemase